tara:strand:- start:399 stop:1241 length:843 start_codon:yes stop_codon:yes gene_type:complete
MINLSTKSKFLIGSFLSKILIFFYGNKKRIVTRNGLKYEIDFKEGVDLGIFFGIKNENNLYKITNYLDKNKKKVLVDVGANIGSVTLPLAQLFHLSNIISIEPTKYAYFKLKKNLDLNPDIKKRVTLHNMFISNKKEKINYVHSSWNFSSKSHTHKIHMGTLKQTSNKTRSLSQLLQKTKKKIDFIKIDVDGYEMEVLKSGQKIIKKHKPLIYFEFAPYLYKEFGYTAKNLIDFIIKDLNYRFFNENFKKEENIYKMEKNLQDRSVNFFLIHKKNISKFN